MKILSTISLVVSTFALLVAISTLRPRSTPELAKEPIRDTVDTFRRLREVETRSAELLSRVTELERRYTGTAPAITSAFAPKVTTPLLPLSTHGSYTFERDAVIYGPDTVVRVSAETTVSSPNGVMVSDLQQKMIVGDLTVKTATAVVHAPGAVMDVSKETVTAEILKFEFLPNKAPEPTTTAVTPRAP